MHQWTDEQRAELEKWFAAGLCEGVGSAEQRCVMAAVRAALNPSASISDEVECAHPLLRLVAIRLNDALWTSANARTEGLRELALALPGTRELSSDAIARGLLPLAYTAADKAVRVHTADALERVGRVDDATTLRRLEPITNKGTADAARAAAAAAYTAAAAAAYTAAWDRDW